MTEKKYTPQQIEGAVVLAMEKVLDKAIEDGAPENIQFREAVEYLLSIDENDREVATFFKVVAMLPPE